jgi:hypothetical protein
MDLIPRHRRRAFLRKAFERLVEIISRPQITAGEVLHALQAYERCMALSTNTASEQLAAAILEPDELPDDAFWLELRNVVKTKYGVDLPVPN